MASQFSEVTLPGDYQHGTRTVLNIAGVNDDIELTVRIPFQLPGKGEKPQFAFSLGNRRAFRL